MTAPKRLIVLAGAAKTGTTALSAALGVQRDISLGTIKEPRFFGSIQRASEGPLVDRFNRSFRREPTSYAANFSAECSTWVDASTDYLNVPESAADAREFAGDTRVVIGLRHPVERAWSEHQHLIRNGAETLDFDAALKAEAGRRANGWVPLFGHVERSMYAPGLEAYLKAFGEAVYVYRYEDLRSDPEVVLAEIERFLGLDERLNLEADVNASGRPRNRLLNNLVRSDNVAIRQTRRLARSMLPAGKGASIRASIDKRNLDASERPSVEAAKWILERTVADSERSAALAGLDLSSYTNFDPESSTDPRR